MKALPLFLLLFIFSRGLSGTGEKPTRRWTNTKGITIEGTYRRSNGDSVWLVVPPAKVETAVPLASLTVADQAVVKEFQSDFSWKLQLPVVWPASVFSKVGRPADDVTKLLKSNLPTFRTPHFEFQTDGKLSPMKVADFGRTFEATRELFARLPWEIRPAPPEGDHYKVRLYEKRADFTDALKIKDEGSARTMGLYVRNDRTIHLPLESLTGVSAAAKDTLRHELTHQMMHDLLPLMPWWVAEGTAEYIRTIPWEDRCAYACDKVKDPAVMKQLAAEVTMNRRAFTEMLSDRYGATAEADTAQLLEAAHHKITEVLEQIRRERAALLAGKANTPPRQTGPQTQTFTGEVVAVETFSIPGPGGLSDEGRATVLKYEAARMFVYYLQHLEGDGKGSKMLMLMWHLRQWADELAGQRRQFEKQAEELRTGIKAVQEGANDFEKMETAYQEALLKWMRTNTGRVTDPPRPAAPEEELLNLLPKVPSAAPFTPMRLQIRWDDIKKKTVGGMPEEFFDDIIAAFKKRNIALEVQEGDPRAMRFNPVKVIK